MVTYTVRGMTCDHCVRAVTRVLSKLPGVTSVEVDLARGLAHVTRVEGPPSDAAVIEALRDEGYEASRS